MKEGLDAHVMLFCIGFGLFISIEADNSLLEFGRIAGAVGRGLDFVNVVVHDVIC